jgi:4-amino-4-deoxy-L-arabinose transferase-like glycosyltransferase
MSVGAPDSAPVQERPVVGARNRISTIFARTDGSGAVWWPASVVGAIIVGLIIWQLAIPRAYYTGTDSVGVRSVVANLDLGHKLCVPDLRLPAGTGRVQLALFAHRPRFAANVSVTAPGYSASSDLLGTPGPTSLAYAAATIPPRPSSPSSVPATLCVSPLDGPLAIGGMLGLPSNQIPARLDGAPVPNRVAVWFLPPAGRGRSLLASAGSIFSRAALFRPGVIGAWTYPVVLFVVLPLAWALSLLLLARAARNRSLRLRRLAIRPAVAIGLIAFVNAGSWALITPAFNAPDEPEHFAYAQYFAETGHAPARVPDSRPPYSTDQTLALDAIDAYSQVNLPDARPPWLALEEAKWKRLRASTPHPADNGGGLTTSASTHQPAYYGLLAPAYQAVSSQSPFSQLTAMRLVSALLGAVVAMCTFGILSELLPRQPVAAIAAGLLVAFHPMFGFISGAINNDSGINAAAAASLYLLIRALRRGFSWRVGLALGAALAVAPLMKQTGWEIYPAGVVGLLGIAWRFRRKLDPRPWAALAATLAAVRAGWSLLQPVFYLSVAGHPGAGGASATGALTLAEHMPGRFLAYLWELFLPKLSFMGSLFPPGWPFRSIYVVRGWGAFGWYSWTFPNWVYLVIILAMAAIGLLAVSAVVRERAGALARGFEIAVIALYPLCVLVAVEAAFFAPNGGGRTVVAEQGRYIFPAIAALAAIAVAGTFGLGRRWHVPLATTLIVAMIGLSYAGQLLTLGSFYT